MIWFKENPILSAFLLVCLGITAAIGYFASEASTNYTTALESLTSQVNSFSSLQKKSPYPTDENLKIISEGKIKYAEALANLKERMFKMAPPLEPITPQEFQDKLREGVNSLRVTAQKNNIKLPEKFFFGFDEYQTQLPSPEAAPALNRDFKVVQKLLQALLLLPIQSLNKLERAAPPVLAAPPTPTPASKKSAEAPPSRAPRILSTKFSLSFTASQDKTRDAINMIPQSDAYLIIRSLTMENSKPSAPSKKDATGPVKDKSPSALQVLLGNESVNTDVSLEIIDFSAVEPTPSKNQ